MFNRYAKLFASREDYADAKDLFEERLLDDRDITDILSKEDIEFILREVLDDQDRAKAQLQDTLAVASFELWLECLKELSGSIKNVRVL